jgi:rhamnose utilization protein RhaD (predicted bifunctional aldolase and dehydrogenase)
VTAVGKLDALVELSRRYGSDPDWVLAGGGNTSWKEQGRLYVKASGASLADIGPGGFCEIDRGRLDAIWSAPYPAAAEAREAAVLSDLMAARAPGEAKRPSVETLMHGLFPQAYVVHSHPAAVNGLACGRSGEAAFGRLFARDAIWVPFVDPGYVLAKAVREELAAFRAREGRTPSIMVMQSHGLLVAGESPREVDELSASVLARIEAELARRPCLEAAAADAVAVANALREIKGLAPEGSAFLFRCDAETLARSASAEAFAPLASAFTPDHIVYAGHEFLRAEPGRITGAWAEYEGRNGVPPRVVVVAGVGAFAHSPSRGAAERALLLYADACKVAAYAESFGGALHMSPEQIDFIRNWEVEKYRSSVSAGGDA